MNDSTRRAIRTALDLIPAIGAALLIVVPVMGLSTEQAAKVAAVVGALTLALAKIRNAAEDAGLIPALLKAPPSPGANPVPDDAEAADGAVDMGHAEVNGVLVMALAIALGLIVWSVIGAHTDLY